MTELPGSSASRWLPSVVVAAVLFCYCAVLLFRHWLPFFYPGDSSRLFYEALLWHRGRIPYRDAFEFAQPGALIFFRSVSALFGWTLSSYAIALAICVVAAGVATQRVAAKFLSPALSIVAAAGVLLLWITIATYHWLAIIQLVIACALIADDAQSCLKDFAAGVFAIGAFFTMQSEGALGTIVFIGYLALRDRLRLKRFLLGALIPAILVFGYFAWQHAIAEFLHCTFVFAVTRVSKGSWQGSRELLLDWQGHVASGRATLFVFQLLAFLGTNALALATLLSRKANDSCRVLSALTIAVSLAVTYGLTSGRFYPAIVIGFPVVVWWLQRVASPRPTLIALSLLILALLGVRMVHLVRRSTVEFPAKIASSRVLMVNDRWSRDLLTRAQWTCDHTSAGDKVAVYPWDPDILLLCDVSNGARFQWLDEGGFNSPEEVSATIHQLELTSPLIGEWNPLVNGALQQIAPTRLLPLKTFLDSCFAEKRQIGDSTMYANPNRTCFTAGN